MDVNGDATMEWDEFYEYIHEQGCLLPVFPCVVRMLACCCPCAAASPPCLSVCFLVLAPPVCPPLPCLPPSSVVMWVGPE